MRDISVRDAGLVATVCVAAVLTLHFIGLEMYLLAIPTVLAIPVCLCLLRRESVPARFVLLPAIAFSAIVYALVAAGIGFTAALALGFVIGGCSALLWLIHRHISAVNQA